MDKFIPLALLSAGLAFPLFALSAEVATVHAVVHSQPLHAGRIDPKLFGNFIELLNDVVPGMWAELLNDRSLEGVLPPVNWCYYDGSPDICDRQWNTNATWTVDTDNSFNGIRCARLLGHSQPATLTQSGLATKRGLAYVFSGYLRADPGVKATVSLKFLLPTGDWMTLGSAELPALSEQWQKYSVQMISAGQTDQAVFELRASGEGNLWADKLSLMPGDNLRAWRSDVIEAVKGVRPALIRWGGSSIDPGHYRWKNASGDRDLRAP